MTARDMIIPFFIAHQGCPHRCIYCNVNKIAGESPERISEDTFRETLHTYLTHTGKKRGSVQVAFYGGNFTGLEKEYQHELLGFVTPFIRKGLVRDVRISTRPDNIDGDRLSLLMASGVTTVEIGAQSFVDEVLKTSQRGHSASDVKNAVKMLKEKGFKTGIHLMAGLPGDSRSGFEYSVDETVSLKPDIVRIHPTVVFQDTPLADLCLSGNYTPLTLSEAIDLCKHALKKFSEVGIPVIRLGLQTNREMETEGSIIAGPFHPAFRSLVEESLFFDMADSLLSNEDAEGKEVTFYLSPQDIASFHGQKKGNTLSLKGMYRLKEIITAVDFTQERGTLVMSVNGRVGKMQRFGKSGRGTTG